LDINEQGTMFDDMWWLEKEIGNEPSSTGHSGIFDMRVIAARASSAVLAMEASHVCWRPNLCQ